MLWKDFRYKIYYLELCMHETYTHWKEIIKLWESMLSWFHEHL